jgi:DNA-binding PadR family transcriptional regulator
MFLYRKRYHKRYFSCDPMSALGKGKTIGVPRGLLRFLVLKMLNEKPMSGTEIIEEIEMQTGSWKPSPGSIYPLLAWLHEKGFTDELPKGELGFKRYCFTEEGKRFFEQQIALGKDFMRKIEFLAPMLIGGFNLGEKNKKLPESEEAAKKLLRSFIFLRKNLDRVTESKDRELARILTECSDKFEKCIQRMKNDRQVMESNN